MSDTPTTMTLYFCCAMCGEDKEIGVTVKDGKIDAAKAIRASGWITQQNGENFDIYCSKRCAS